MIESRIIRPLLTRREREHVRKILTLPHNQVGVTLNVPKRKIISKFRSPQRFWIALKRSYHLLLINQSHLIFHFFTVPCLQQHFYLLGILVHNSSSKHDCTTLSFKLLTHRFTTSGCNCFMPCLFV